MNLVVYHSCNLPVFSNMKGVYLKSMDKLLICLPTLLLIILSCVIMRNIAVLTRVH